MALFGVAKNLFIGSSFSFPTCQVVLAKFLIWWCMFEVVEFANIEFLHVKRKCNEITYIMSFFQLMAKQFILFNIC